MTHQWTRAGAVLLLGAVYSFGGSGHLATAQVMPNPERPPMLSELRVEGAAGGGFAPRKLHWDADPTFSDRSRWEPHRRTNRRHLEQGRVPFMGTMRWTNTYFRSNPELDEQGEHRLASMHAWHQWLGERRDLWAVTADGEQHDAHHRGERVGRGHISLAMPLDRADWIGGRPTAYGAWMAHRLARHAVNHGLRGWSTADYFDSIPHADTHQIDFHPRILDRFEQVAGIRVPGDDVAARAAYLLDPTNELMPAWNDFWCDAYADFWAQTLRLMRRQLGPPVAYQMQISYMPSHARLRGVDTRRIREALGDTVAWTFVSVELQGDGGRNLKPMHEIAPRLGLHAAREPDLQMTMIMSAPQALPLRIEEGHAFWRSVRRTADRHGLTLDDAQTLEYGGKYVKEGWLSAAWIHLANRDGSVRRALQGMQRHYHDRGQVPNVLAELIRDVRPVRPWGVGLYYAVPVERSFEAQGQPWGLYQRVHDAGRTRFTPGYYVSDVALTQLGDEGRPTAWITADPDRLSEAERDALEALAPLYDVSQWHEAMTPIAFDRGATGYAFVDQHGRVNFLVSRVDHEHTDTREIHITFDLGAEHDGTYQVRDLIGPDEVYNRYADDVLQVQIEKGRGSIRISLERWDTRAFTTDLPAVLGSPAP